MSKAANPTTVPPMTMAYAMAMAGGRDKFADLFGVEVITTYHWPVDQPVPARKLKVLTKMRPEWVRSWEAHWCEQQAQAAEAAK